MRKFLIIAADQEALDAKPGPHTLKDEHVQQLHKAVGKHATIVIATPEESKQYLPDAEMVAAFPMRMPDIARVPQAKWLHSFSAGVDGFLTPALVESKIILSSSSGVHATPIAEHIVGFMLNFTRGFPNTHRQQMRHEWRKDQRIGEIRGSNVLVVGLGEIGMETARLLSAFGANVSAIARSPKKKIKFISKVGTAKQLDAMLPTADFVIITLPYTKETHHLFDRSKFKLMKRTAVIINIGRGSIIKEPDLIEALAAREIGGAGLDVTEVEPLSSENPLWDMENVVITPHHSGLSQKYMDRAVELLCKNIKAYLAKKPLPTLVNKKLGY